MVTPKQVLDEQAALLSFIENPEYIEYGATIASTIQEKQRALITKSVYSERNVNRVRKTVSEIWLPILKANLQTAYAFHVSDEMLDLANWAGHLLPDDTSLSHEMLPAESGFLMFEHGMKIPEVWGRDTYVHALAWHNAMLESTNGPGLPGIEIYTFTDINDARDDVTREMREANGAKYEKWARLLGHLHITSVHQVAYGEKQAPIEAIPEDYADLVGFTARYANKDDQLVAMADNWIRTLIAIFILMGQTVSTVEKVDSDRAQAKRMRRMNLPTQVTVITLRRSSASKHEGESQVEWQHRWVVRGHWAWRHCGDGHPFAEPSPDGGYRCRVWIAPYVKGPDDKPMMITDKVMALRR